MTLALQLARKGEGKTLPNPLVGAVAVKNGVIVGKGYHAGFGKAHAERMALRGAPDGSTLYVSLEPCVEFTGKKTPACVDLILRKKVRSVYIAQRDPNPHVKGKGIALLRRSGVNVYVGLEGEEARRLNRIYMKNMLTSLPFVALKMASSLDGRVATEMGESRWITSHSARKHVHRLRSQFDAVLTSSRTVLIDDPHLGVRHVSGSDPLRIILDRDLKTSLSAQVYRDSHVLLVTEKKSPLPDSVDCIRYDFSHGLEGILKQLFERGVRSILVEAGGGLNAAFLNEQLADYSYVFTAPLILGAEGVPMVRSLHVQHLDDAIRLKKEEVQMFGHDILVEGFIHYSNT